jgi:hypothetical protein
MKDRIKWLGVGVGVMYGTQLLILLMIHGERATRLCKPVSHDRVHLGCIHGRRFRYRLDDGAG